MCEIVHFVPIIQYTKNRALSIPTKSVSEGKWIEKDRLIDIVEMDFHQWSKKKAPHTQYPCIFQINDIFKINLMETIWKDFAKAKENNPLFGILFHHVNGDYGVCLLHADFKQNHNSSEPLNTGYRLFFLSYEAKVILITFKKPRMKLFEASCFGENDEI